MVSVSKSTRTPPCDFPTSFFSGSLELTAAASFLGEGSILLGLTGFGLGSLSLLRFTFCSLLSFEVRTGFVLVTVWLSCFPVTAVSSSDGFASSWDWTACLVIAVGVRGVDGVTADSSDRAIV